MQERYTSCGAKDWLDTTAPISSSVNASWTFFAGTENWNKREEYYSRLNVKDVRIQGRANERVGPESAKFNDETQRVAVAAANSVASCCSTVFPGGRCTG